LRLPPIGPGGDEISNENRDFVSTMPGDAWQCPPKAKTFRERQDEEFPGC
jgi:hypothetical protein